VTPALILPGATRFHALMQSRPGAVDLLLSMLVRGAGIPLAFVANLLIARLLGPEKFGLYMTLLSVALVGGGLAAYGLGPVLTREIAAAPSTSWVDVLRSTGVWALRFSTRLSLITMAFVLLWLTWGPGAPTSSWLQRIITISIIPLTVATTLVVGVLSGMSQVARSQSIGTIWRNSFLLIGVVLLLVFEVSHPIGVLLMQVMSLGLSVLVALFWIRRSMPRSSRLSDGWLGRESYIQPEQARVLHRAARHFLTVSLAWLVLGRLDVVIVNALAGTTQAGYFGAAARLGQFGGMAGLIWVAWLQPRISAHYHAKRRDEIQRLISLGFWGALVITALLVATAWFVAPRLMGWMGEGFEPAIMPFRWLLLGYLPWAASVPFYAYLSMSGREASLSRILWIQVLVTLGVSFPLIHQFGALGGTWAWSGGLALGSFTVISVSAFHIYRAKRSANA